MSYFWHPIKKILIGYDEGTGCVVELTKVEIKRLEEKEAAEADRATTLPPQPATRSYKKHETAEPIDKEEKGRKQLGATASRVKELHAQGKSNTEIAKDVGTRENSVSYHLKQLGLKANPASGAPRRTLFSESTFNTVKSLFNQGHGVDFIVSEKGFDSNEVRKIRDAKSYDDYFRT